MEREALAEVADDELQVRIAVEHATLRISRVTFGEGLVECQARPALESIPPTVGAEGTGVVDVGDPLRRGRRDGDRSAHPGRRPPPESARTPARRGARCADRAGDHHSDEPEVLDDPASSSAPAASGCPRAAVLNAANRSGYALTVPWSSSFAAAPWGSRALVARLHGRQARPRHRRSRCRQARRTGPAREMPGLVHVGDPLLNAREQPSSGSRLGCQDRSILDAGSVDVLFDASTIRMMSSRSWKVFRTRRLAARASCGLVRRLPPCGSCRGGARRRGLDGTDST